ncbi:hypothetical protein GGX14DRAFT_563359 [Mycena pura]|uniref:Uncharacterized protein n=1 Tax=Mycena pura TaxID=153505 RepID=A0AAD6VJC9_9AGAR|nr:hypothetical protein GGX14DRAFT_563359 [Mycena pura]
MSEPCPALPRGNFQLLDFQGLCLTALTSSGPVIAEDCISTFPADQTWSLVPVNRGFILFSGLSQGPELPVFLNLGNSNGAVTSEGTTGFGFNISCFPFDFNAVTLVDNLVVNGTLTSSETDGETAQVLFEPLANSFNQIWSIEVLD